MYDIKYRKNSLEIVRHVYALIVESGITDVLVLYEMINLLTDTGIIKLTK